MCTLVPNRTAARRSTAARMRGGIDEKDDVPSCRSACASTRTRRARKYSKGNRAEGIAGLRLIVAGRCCYSTSERGLDSVMENIFSSASPKHADSGADGPAIKSILAETEALCEGLTDHPRRQERREAGTLEIAAASQRTDRSQPNGFATQGESHTHPWREDVRYEGSHAAAHADSEDSGELHSGARRPRCAQLGQQAAPMEELFMPPRRRRRVSAELSDQRSAL